MNIKQKAIKKTFLKILSAVSFILLLSIIGLTYAWFTDKQNLSNEFEFGKVSIKLDDGTTEDKSSTAMCLNVYRNGTKLDAGRKIMPGDEIKITLRITNSGEECYYLVEASTDCEVLQQKFDNDFFVENSILYTIKNQAGRNIYYKLIDENYLSTYSVENNVETFVENGSKLGKLALQETTSIEISQKIDEEFTQEDLEALSSNKVKINCDVFAIQQANLSEIEAYKQLKRLSNESKNSQVNLINGEQLLKDNGMGISKLTLSNGASVKFMTFQNYTMFAGKTVTQIDIPVRTVSALDENQTFTIAKINFNTGEITQKLILKIPYSQLSNCSTTEINKFVKFENLDIQVGQNETLYFGASDNDSITFGYTGKIEASNFYLLCSTTMYNNDNAQTPNRLTAYNMVLPFNIYTKNDIKTNLFEGKYVSILGDSISTYAGYINKQNSTTSGNGNFYGSTQLASVNDTYWMQVINNLNMKFCVNNSWSGTTLTGIGQYDQDGAAGGYNRANQLHDDTLSDNPNNEVINPDIILLNMGINDCALGFDAGSLNSSDFSTIEASVDAGNFKPSTFAEAYVTAVYKMSKAYPNVKIFCLNIPFRNAKTDTNLDDFNKVILQVTNHYKNTYLVDIYSSQMSGTNYANYTVPNSSSSHDNIHPNALGMDIISDLIIKQIQKYGA